MSTENIPEVKPNDENIEQNETVKEKQTTKEYMKEYYAKNKDVLIQKMLTKEKCPHCDRIIAHQQLFKHQNTKYCKSRRELNNTFKRT